MRLIPGTLLAAIIGVQLCAQADPPATPPHKNIFDMTPDRPTTAAVPPPAAPARTDQGPASSPSSPADAAAVYLRVPSENELVDAKRRLDQLFGSDLAAARTPEKKLDLAETLMLTAAEEKTDHAAQYQMLTTARDLAIKAQDFQFACKAIQQLGSLFYVDVLQQEVSTAAAFRVALMAMPDRRLFCLQLQALVPTMISAGRFDLVATVDDLSRSAAVAAGDGTLVRQIRRVTDEHSIARVVYGSLEVARQRLKAHPTDADANTAMGKYYCFDLGDWKTGLPMLAIGSDKKLKDAAFAELNLSPEMKNDSFANLWWDIAADQGEPARHRVQAHAAEYYATALPNLTGLAKKEIARRIESVRDLPSEIPTAIDLLDLVDTTRDTVSGGWDRTAIGTLQCAKGGLIALPYHPPAEYDLRVVFTRANGKDLLGLICIAGAADRQFTYLLSGWGDSVAGFNYFDCQSADRSRLGQRGHWITNDLRQTLIIRVRADGLQEVLDDKNIGTELHTDFRDMNVPRADVPGRRDALGLRCGKSGFVIHSAYVIEITGHGHAVSGEAASSPTIATAVYTRQGNNNQPFTITFRADGTLESTIDARGIWAMHGNDLFFRWDDTLVTCKLSADRKSFVGKHADSGAVVSGRVTDGGL